MTDTASTPTGYRGELVRDSTPCGNCGYDLKGLFVGSRCPECGSSVSNAQGSGRERHPEILGRPLIEGPEWYLRMLVVAFGMMTVSWLITPVFVLFAMFGFHPLGFVPDGTLEVLIACAWSGGVLLTLQPRPSSIRGRKNGVPIREYANLRLIVGLMQIPVVLAPITMLLAGVAATPGPLLLISVLLTAMAVGGYTPTALYFAQVADWASDNELAQKLRAYGWLIGIGLVGCVFVYAAIRLQTFLPILPVIASFFWILVFLMLVIATILLALSTIKLTNMARWLIVNRRALLERDQRMIDKARRDAESMAARHPAPVSAPEYDRALYDAVIEKHKADEPEHEAPGETRTGPKYSSEQRLEKQGDNPYGLEEGES